MKNCYVYLLCLLCCCLLLDTYAQHSRTIATLYLYNALGVQLQTIQGQPGMNTILLAELTPGLYFIQSPQHTTTRFIKR